MNANERATVQAQAREQLARVQGTQSIERLRVQGEQQIRRDQLKADAELSKLRVKTESDIRRRQTPTVAQELRLRERSRKIRLADARKRIRLSQKGRGSPQEAMCSISVLGEVDPDAARVLRADFQRNPVGGQLRGRALPLGKTFEPIPPSRALVPTGGPKFGGPVPEATVAQAGKQAFRGKLLKGGLLGGAAAVGIPLLLKLMGGGKKKAGEELPPEIQMQLMQAMTQGGDRGVDPALGTGRQLRNVFQLLQIIKTLRDMQGLQQQPTGGLV